MTLQARRIGHCFIAVVVTVAAVTTIGPKANAAPASPAAGYGFSLYGGDVQPSAQDLDRELDAVSQTGATWLRVVFDAFRIETAKGQFDWTYPDLLVNSARKHNLKVLVVVSFAPDWSRPAGAPFSAPPTDDEDFADFAAATAQRYADRVSHWEIWNEPNATEYLTFAGDTATRYTALLKAAYSAIKKVQPNSTVITGGLSRAGQTTPPVFVERMYSAGAQGYFDAVAMHPYVSPAGITADPYNGWTDVARVHAIMVAHGDGGKSIWLTELGAPTAAGPDGVSQQEQAKQITDVLAAAASTGFCGPAFIFTVRDVGGARASDPNYSFGALLTADWQPKAAAGVLHR